MNILWNCQGANKPNFIRSDRILKQFDADILALFETHAGGDRVRRICHSLGFDKSFRVDAVGQSWVCGYYGEQESETCRWYSLPNILYMRNW